MTTTLPAQTAIRAGGISVSALSKRYGTAMTAMADVSLEVDSGEFVAVVGASGCGKSTLLRIIAGFEQPTNGTVAVDGDTVTKPGPSRGVVFQDYGLFPWLTVRENVMCGPRQRKASRPTASVISDRFIDAVGLTRMAGKYPHELSGGMQQRVAIARVLANEPSVLLMDEPFGALDALTRSSLQIELSRIHKTTGTTVVFVTHSIEEAVFLADRVVVMTGGASHGVPGHVKEIVTIDPALERDVNSPEFNLVKRRISDLVHGDDIQH